MKPIKYPYTAFINFLLLTLTVSSCRGQVINAGVSGNNTQDLLNRLEADVLDHNPDLVILMAGTNDMLNPNKMLSYETYETNLLKLVETIKNNNIALLLLSPPPTDSTYLVQRHGPILFPKGPNAKLNKTKQIISNTAQTHQISYFDLNQSFKDINLPNHNSDLFIKNQRNSGKKDGVHPTPLGYRFMAETIFQYLKSEYLLQKKQKIICFGDSITYGGGAKNASKVLTGNYPFLLSQLIASHFETN